LQELQGRLKGKLLTFRDKSYAVCQEIFLEACLETGGQDFETFYEVITETLWIPGGCRLHMRLHFFDGCHAEENV